MSELAPLPPITTHVKASFAAATDGPKVDGSCKPEKTTRAAIQKMILQSVGSAESGGVNVSASLGH